MKHFLLVITFLGFMTSSASLAFSQCWTPSPASVDHCRKANPNTFCHLNATYVPSELGLRSTCLSRDLGFAEQCKLNEYDRCSVGLYCNADSNRCEKRLTQGEECSKAYLRTEKIGSPYTRTWNADVVPEGNCLENHVCVAARVNTDMTISKCQPLEPVGQPCVLDADAESHEFVWPNGNCVPGVSFCGKSSSFTSATCQPLLQTGLPCVSNTTCLTGLCGATRDTFKVCLSDKPPMWDGNAMVQHFMYLFLGCVAGIVVILLACYCFIRRRRAKKVSIAKTEINKGFT